MGVVGFQDFWVVGARFYFERSAVAGIEQRTIDLGVVADVSPAFEVEKLELEDADGGVKRTVDETLSKIDETYTVTFNNFNPDNLALMFLSEEPTEIGQAAAIKLDVPHYGYPGALLKIKDNDAARTKMAGLSSIISVGDASLTLGSSISDLTTINKANGTFSFTADPGLVADDVFILYEAGLTDIANAGTYEVASITGAGPFVVTVKAVSQSLISSDESSLTTAVVKTDTAGVLYIQGVDWEIVSLDRGMARMMTGGSFAAAADLIVTYGTTAITGLRKIAPQNAGEVKGSGILVFSRGNNAEQTIRDIPLLSITPQSPDFSADDYSSWQAEIKVLADTTLGESAGTLTSFKGTLPATS